MEILVFTSIRKDFFLFLHFASLVYDLFSNGVGSQRDCWILKGSALRLVVKHEANSKVRKINQIL